MPNESTSLVFFAAPTSMASVTSAAWLPAAAITPTIVPITAAFTIISSCFLCVPLCVQHCGLFIAKQARTRQEAPPGSVIKGEHAAITVHHIDNQLRVFPVLVLFKPHVERHAAQVAEIDVGLAE